MRLIDADNLLTAFPAGEDEIFHTSAVRGTINACQTVDAVPVVRCEDCARFDKKRGCNLVEGLNIAKTDSFCSYGERKDGERHEND